MSFQFLGPIEDIESNISYFPLYDRLLEKVKRDNIIQSATLPNSTLIKIANDIRDLDKESTDLIFVLIRVHSLREGQDNVFSLPYEAKRSIGEDEFDIEYDLLDLPIMLQAILYQFVKANSNCSSPKRESAKPQKTFLKRPTKPQDTTFVLKKVNPASLDKQHNLKDVVEAGTKTAPKPFTNKFTKIDSIGLVKEDEHDKPFTIPALIASSECKINCCYCTLPVPQNMEAIVCKRFKFCSYNCALAFSITCPVTCPKEIVLSEIEKLFGSRKCKPSPPYLLLEKFGGSLSPRSYRKEMQHKEFINIPMIRRDD